MDVPITGEARGGPAFRRLAVTGQLFEGTFVEICDQYMDTVIQLRQREEDLEAPSLHYLYHDFGFGFVLRFSWTSGYHCNQVALRQLLISGIQFGIVMAGLANPLFRLS